MPEAVGQKKGDVPLTCEEALALTDPALAQEFRDFEEAAGVWTRAVGKVGTNVEQYRALEGLAEVAQATGVLDALKEEMKKK